MGIFPKNRIDLTRDEVCAANVLRITLTLFNGE